ncbi:MAG: hypothetical protein KIH62_003415, partial [Candidatus Kerfeldbacteria bacterium]|nr:hypothetical protein [Candidatus Kerfeldbacteria bacterium]
ATLSPDVVDRLIGANDGEVKESGGDEHAPTNLRGVLEWAVRQAVNVVEVGVEPMRIAPFFNNQGNKDSIIFHANGLLESVGICLTNLNFEAPDDALGAEIERIQQMEKAGVNPTAAATATAGGGKPGAASASDALLWDMLDRRHARREGRKAKKS